MKKSWSPRVEYCVFVTIRYSSVMRALPAEGRTIDHDLF